MPITTYAPSYWAKRGSGDGVWEPTVAETGINDWATSNLIFGQPGNKVDTEPHEDLFLKYNLGPITTIDTQIPIPPKSTIHSAEIICVPASNLSDTMTVRTSTLVTMPTAGGNGTYYGPLNISWATKSPRYAEFERMWFNNKFTSSGSRVDDSGALEVAAPGASSDGLASWRHGANPGGAGTTHEFAQENKITGGASFDKVHFELAKKGSPTSEVLWVEIWDKGPVGPNTPDPTGTLLATSDTVALSSLTTSPADVEFTFVTEGSPVTLGAGDTPVWSWIRSDSGFNQWKIGYEYHTGSTVGYNSRITGYMDSFGPGVYPGDPTFPHCSGGASDTLNANAFDTAPKQVLPAWVTEVDTSFTGIGPLVQSWVNRPEYKIKDPIGFVVEVVDVPDSETDSTRRPYLSSHSTFPGPTLKINFTAPFSRRLKSRYGW